MYSVAKMALKIDFTKKNDVKNSKTLCIVLAYS